jgi:excinuclease ABC subunit A
MAAKQAKKVKRPSKSTTSNGKPPVVSRRDSIAIHGARVHNLKNITVEIPRDKLTVVTGLSGSGKSSLAFDTLYAEGQRRYMESISSYAKRFIAQVEKPDVDFMSGLSPVISIEQKTTARNPRSTVGTLTDISSYLNLLFDTIGKATCPRTDEPTPVLTAAQITEAILALPKGSEIELRAPVFKLYGEDLDVLFTEIRKQGCRRLIIDGKEHDLADELDLDASQVKELEVIVDRFIIDPTIEKQLRAGIDHALLVGDSTLSVIVTKASKTAEKAFYKRFGSNTRHYVYGDIGPEFFTFNNPESACRTCGGLGTNKQTHPDLLIPDPDRSIRAGCFIRDAFTCNPDNWYGHLMYTLSKAYKFSLDTPWKEREDPEDDSVWYRRQRTEAPETAR